MHGDGGMDLLGTELTDSLALERASAERAFGDYVDTVLLVSIASIRLNRTPLWFIHPVQ